MDINITATKARQDFFKLIEKTSQSNDKVTITIDGEPKALLMSIEEYEGWVETLEIMSDPVLMKELNQALKDVKNGKTYTEEEVIAFLKK